MWMTMSRNMSQTMTKKLQKLLLKHKKANRARLSAYARRSRILGGVCIQQEDEQGNLTWKRVHKVLVTEELKAQLDADIEKARLHRLAVSAELRAYCKKKKLHLEWNSDNHIIAIRNHAGWMLHKKHKVAMSFQYLLKAMNRLQLTKVQPHYPYR